MTALAIACLALAGLGIPATFSAMRAANAQWIHWRTIEVIGFAIAAALFFLAAK